MKLTVALAFLTLTLSSNSFGGETWDKTKGAINTGAEKVDRGTRKAIDKGKQKMEERKERKERKEREEAREKRKSE